MLAALLLLLTITAMKPASDSIAPVELPDVDVSQRETLAVVHNRASRIVPFGGKRYLLVYASNKDNVSGALMHGTTAMPYVITPVAALPRVEREGTTLGRFVDAALLEDKSFAASAVSIPAQGGEASAIIFYDFGPDNEPNPTLAIRLKGCVGAIAPGPSSSVVALTDRGVTVLSRDGVVLGELLKETANCADNRLTRIAANRYALYDAAKQQVSLFRLDLDPQRTKGEGKDWRDADYAADPVAKATIEKTLDVSESGSGPVKSLHVDKNGNVFLVRADTVFRFEGRPAQSWGGGRDWGAVHWDGDTLVALTKNAHWQRLRF